MQVHGHAHYATDMEDFTPPPPPSNPIQSEAPPLPPPPRDLPEHYRALSPTSTTDSMISSAQSPIDGPAPASRQSFRRGSFGFLSQRKNTFTSEEGHKMLRKQKLREKEEQLRHEREFKASNLQTNMPPPVLPSHDPLEPISTFGGEDRPDSVAIISNKASNFSRPYAISPSNSLAVMNNRNDVAPSQRDAMAGSGGQSINGEYVGPQAREQSMTSRGRYSTSSGAVGNVNSPRRVRRRKDPTPFNVLIVGAKNSGKTSFIQGLKSSLVLPPQQQHGSPTMSPQMTTSDGNFTSHTFEADIERERIGVTLWDSQGLEKNLVDLQLREMTSFIERKFEDTFTEEQKVMRSPSARDTHIHCVFLVLDPVRLDLTLNASKKHVNSNAFAAVQGPAGLDEELDLQVMKTLAGKTTVIPVVSKADTLTSAHANFLKRCVWGSIQAEKLDPLEALGLEESDDEESDPDSDDLEHSDDSEGLLPIQSTASDSSEMVDAKEDQEHEHESSELDHSMAGHSSSPDVKTNSTNTTQSSPAKFDKVADGNTLPATTSDDLYIPFSIISPDPYAPDIRGRQFPWGIADPYNPNHCDFLRLRDSVFAEWRNELRTAAREKWYEGWRTSRLKHTPRRVRQAGGVTPVGVVPREGRTFSAGTRKTSNGPGGLGLTAESNDVPRAASSSKAERILGSPQAFATAY